MKLQKQIEVLDFLNSPNVGRKLKSWLEMLDDDAQECVMHWILDAKEYHEELANWQNGKRIDK